MTRARIGDVVEVDWLDAWCDHDISNSREWKDSMPVTTRGILLRDGDVVSVAGEVFPNDDNYRCVTHIPRAIVQRVRKLTA